MYVTFKIEGEECAKIMVCFYNNQDEQADLMHRSDIDKQVKEWQKSNIGQPPKFYSRVNILEFISDKEAFKRNISF
jgi:hypothetical protein